MTIQRGDRGNFVIIVQRKLSELGYVIDIDGIFGKNTEIIIKLYQQKNGLESDGKVGKITFKHLVGIEIDKYFGYESSGNVNGNKHNLEVIDYENKCMWVLDNGHGGIINGVYQTNGKRSPQVPPGVFEGEVNRNIVKKIIEYANENNISYCNLVPENQDIKLSTRVDRAHKVQLQYSNCIYVSIHCNAYGTSWNNINGIETYYYKDNVAENIAHYFQRALIQETGRRDRGIKEANFYVLRKTTMPAILLECGFMSNLEEATLLNTTSFINKIAEACVIAMMSYENSLI